MTDHVIAKDGELEEGERVLIQAEGKEVGVFYKNGDYHAYLNWCPHQGGPVCEGQLTGTQSTSFDRDTLELEVLWDNEGEILNCPWHGWEFDVGTGECLSRPMIKLPTYRVTVQEGEVILSI